MIASKNEFSFLFINLTFAGTFSCVDDRADPAFMSDKVKKIQLNRDLQPNAAVNPDIIGQYFFKYRITPDYQYNTIIKLVKYFPFELNGSKRLSVLYIIIKNS